ncbi:CLUMA_CG018640, isoform A [Clunio marinus]|uniref:CLUMA_CG018640, isoform A n=1 Tax=Clunio marinus TaxID=568069 RepID=A0A1J1IZ48_9DIPT|nr:CLUMA_CG018640, isoform A [Clunio marinus]
MIEQKRLSDNKAHSERLSTFVLLFTREQVICKMTDRKVLKFPRNVYICTFLHLLKGVTEAFMFL